MLRSSHCKIPMLSKSPAFFERRCMSSATCLTPSVMDRLFIVNCGTSWKGAFCRIFSITWNKNTWYQKKICGEDFVLSKIRFGVSACSGREHACVRHSQLPRHCAPHTGTQQWIFGIPAVFLALVVTMSLVVRCRPAVVTLNCIPNKRRLWLWR